LASPHHCQNIQNHHAKKVHPHAQVDQERQAVSGLTEREFGISRQQLDAIRDWAQNDPYIQEVRVFGSRAKGRARIDSDLDIAITASDGIYTSLSRKWQDEISDRTGLRARVSQYNCAIDDTVRRYCDEDQHTILVFQRPPSPGMKRPGRA
jgi:predicted nucleotidyltransferase